MTKRKKRSQNKTNNGCNNHGGSNSNNDDSKRARRDTDGRGFELDNSKGYIDPTTGQRGAFPGLEGDEGDFYGPANDGLDYIRMVRSEAKGIPSLLIAEQKTKRPLPLPTARDSGLNYDDDDEFDPDHVKDSSSEVEGPAPELDEEGWYHDGAYTAFVGPVKTPSADEPPPTALTLWHTMLLTSFRNLRTTLHSSPPPPAAPVIPADLPQRKRRSLWQQHIFNTLPTPRELWGIDQQTVLRLLSWLTQRLGGTDKNGIGKYWSQWLWGLLVRLDNCLTAEEVCIVRDLGKRCVIIRERMAMRGGYTGFDSTGKVDEASTVGEIEVEWGIEAGGVEEGGVEEMEEGEAEEMEEGEVADGGVDHERIADIPPITPRIAPGHQDKSRELEPGNCGNIDALTESKDPPSFLDTLATLDMVVSLVGDFYGQRDLLAQRKTALYPSKY